MATSLTPILMRILFEKTGWTPRFYAAESFLNELSAIGSIITLSLSFSRPGGVHVKSSGFLETPRLLWFPNEVFSILKSRVLEEIFFWCFSQQTIPNCWQFWYLSTLIRLSGCLVMILRRAQRLLWSLPWLCIQAARTRECGKDLISSHQAEKRLENEWDEGEKRKI